MSASYTRAHRLIEIILQVNQGWKFNSNTEETFSNLPLNPMYHLHKTSVSTLASKLHAEHSRGRCCMFIIADLSWHNVQWSKVPRQRTQLQLAWPNIGRQISHRFFCIHHWKFKGVWTFSDESTDAVGLRGVSERSEQMNGQISNPALQPLNENSADDGL